jgi:transposase-like protein
MSRSVRETKNPGVSVAQVCRRHGVATSMIFRWPVDFGLSARKAPQLVTVALADGAANEPPAPPSCAISCGRPTA